MNVFNFQYISLLFAIDEKKNLRKVYIQTFKTFIYSKV